MRLVLGSSSAIRAEILARLGIPFEVVTADIDEKAIRHRNPEALTRAIAAAKASAVRAKLEGTGPATLITADSIVLFKGQIREKPSSVEEARAFLTEYSGRIVETVTTIVVTTTDYSGAWLYQTDRAYVHYGELNVAAIENALARGAVLHSAGALVIGDSDLKPYIRALYGASDSIEGLPLGVVVPLLNQIGYRLL